MLLGSSPQNAAPLGCGSHPNTPKAAPEGALPPQGQHPGVETSPKNPKINPKPGLGTSRALQNGAKKALFAYFRPAAARPGEIAVNPRCFHHSGCFSPQISLGTAPPPSPSPIEGSRCGADPQNPPNPPQISPAARPYGERRLSAPLPQQFFGRKPPFSSPSRLIPGGGGRRHQGLFLEGGGGKRGFLPQILAF